MENQTRALLLTLCVSMILLVGCKSGAGMSASGSPAKYLETFYKGDGAELYFIKPFTWKSETGKEWVDLDITYDFAKDSIRPLTANFSFLCEDAAKKIENVSIKLESGEKKFYPVERIYVEKDPKKKKFYHNRHTFSISYEDLKSLVATEAPTFALTANGKVYTFGTPKKWKKRSSFLQEFMIDTIELNQ